MESTIELDSAAEALAVCGPADRHLRRLMDRFGIRVVARDRRLKLSGEPQAVREADLALRRLIERVRSGETIAERELDTVLSAAEPERKPAEPTTAIRRVPRERKVRPLTRGQAAYLEQMANNEIVFVTGPAGTGKTFLAVLKAVELLKAGEVDKLVLCRPAVEAGERLGFLPGDFQAKIHPYLRPLYDALHNLLEVETVRKLMEVGTIEIVPLAYMRGRTLERAFIILDEAQNATIGQMKMFLTRMGRGSRIVVTGDISQVDLPAGQVPGLTHILRILEPGDGIAFCRMRKVDIVRHPLVWRIVRAFEQAEGHAGIEA